MPFIYSCHPKGGAQALDNFATNGTTNTENDFFFLKPAASRPATMTTVRVQGKANAMTNLNGISVRVKQWTTTASTSTAGTSFQPVPKNKLAPAIAATAGIASASNSTITSGTGAAYVGFASMGGSGPGGIVPINPDDVPLVDGGTTMSIDLVSSAVAASLAFEWSADSQEG